MVERLKGQGTGFQSLMGGIDTTTTGRKLVFHIMGALADNADRDLIQERTKAGMKAAKRCGKHQTCGASSVPVAGQVIHMR